LARQALQRGHEVVPYDRQVAPPNNEAKVRSYVARIAPEATVHLAIPSQPTGATNEGELVQVRWTRMLALACREIGCRFLFASTADVYSADAKGPFLPSHPPDAIFGAGSEKRRGEESALDAYPTGAFVARLGLQIGLTPEGNQLLSRVEQQIAEQGAIRASREWFPACAFIDVTAVALLRLVSGELAAGLYHLDSNRGWSHFQIVEALMACCGINAPLGPDESRSLDQRLLDRRLELEPLSRKLPTLPSMVRI